jgi:hypothetical protein
MRLREDKPLPMTTIISCHVKFVSFLAASLPSSPLFFSSCNFHQMVNAGLAENPLVCGLDDEFVWNRGDESRHDLLY